MPSCRWSRVIPLLLLATTLQADSVGVAAAQEPASLRLLELSDYYDLVRTGDIVVAADGRRVVFSRSGADADADLRRTSLWEMRPGGGGVRRLVEQGSHPRLSPDGAWLGYLRDGQVWLLPLSSGAPWQLTGLPAGVTDFAWAPDSDRIVLVSHEPRDAAVAAQPAPAMSTSATTTCSLSTSATSQRRRCRFVVSPPAGGTMARRRGPRTAAGSRSSRTGRRTRTSTDSVPISGW